MRGLKNARRTGGRDVAAEIPSRVNAGLPVWAVLPAAWKLIVEAIKHPNAGTLILVDPNERSVEARPLSGVEELEWTGRARRVGRES